MPEILSSDQLSVDNSRLPFAEQIAFFQSKLGEYVASEAWDEILKAALVVSGGKIVHPALAGS
jgi:hypothetical protein